MNLFWETRHLSQAREDHLTCFIAAALESDPLFRTAYERSVRSVREAWRVTHPVIAVRGRQRRRD